MAQANQPELEPYRIESIFDPLEVPIYGQNSSLAPSSLTPGFFASLQNIRFNNKSCTVRNGNSQLATPPQSGTAFRGAWSGYLNGTLWIVAAYRISNYTHVYSLNTSTFTWTEITQDGTDATYGNEYGATRFPTDGWINYAPIQDILGNPLLFIQNSGGTDAPRIFDPSLFTSSIKTCVSTHQQVPVPATGSLSSVTAYFGASVPSGASSPYMTNFAQITSLSGIPEYTNSSASEFALSSITGNPYKYPNLYINTTATSSPTAVMNWYNSDVLNVVGCRQLILGCSGSYLTVFPNLQIELLNSSGTAITIYNANNLNYSPALYPQMDPNDTNSFMVGISLDGLDPTGAVLGACNSIRFTWLGTTGPATAQNIKFSLIAFSGLINGGASYAVTNYSAGGRGESAPLLTPAPVGAQVVSGFTTYSLPIFESFYYTYAVAYTNISATYIEAPYAVSHNYFYRQDIGDNNFYYTGEEKTGTGYSTGSGAWDTSYALKASVYVDNTAPGSKNYSMVAPSYTGVCIPQGTSVLNDNSRLYIGGVSSNSGSSQNQVWISADQQWTRFTSSVNYLNTNQVDPRSGTVITFTGEQVTGFGRLSGYLIGVDPIVLFTRSSAYRLDGIDSRSLSRPTWIGPHGTPYPRSVAEHSGYIYWLDCENQVCIMQGSGINQISRMVVDKELASGTLTNATGVWHNQRYYLGYQPSGQSVNTNALVFEELYQQWSEDYYAAGDANQFVKIPTPTGVNVYVFSSTGYVYQLDVSGQTTDAGTAIPVTITTREYHSRMWEWITFGRVGIVGDPVSTSTQLTVTRNWKPQSSGESGGINLYNSQPNNAYLWETNSDTTYPGGSGISVQISISGSLPGGYNIYSLVTEMKSENTDRAGAG